MVKTVDSIIPAGKTVRRSHGGIQKKRFKVPRLDFRPHVGRFFVVIVLALTFISASVVAVYVGTSMGEYKRYGGEKAAKENLVAMIGARILSLREQKQFQVAAVAAQEEAAKIVRQAATAAASSTPKTAAKKTVENSVAVAVSSLTPQKFLDRTTISLRQKLDGSYGVELTTKLSGSKTITWYPSDETAGIRGSASKFMVAFSCTEPYDQSPGGFSFLIRTSYHCELSLTDGKNAVIAAVKKLTFDTGPGILSVAQASAFSAYFQEGITRGGLIFSNTDSAPVAVTGLQFDLSFTSIATTTDDGRLATLRFSDSSGAVLGEYSLPNAAPDPARPSFYGNRAVKVAFSTPVDAGSQKPIFIEILGSHRLGFDTDPNITLYFTRIGVSPTEVKIVGVPILISWTCSAQPNPNNPDRNCH